MFYVGWALFYVILRMLTLLTLDCCLPRLLNDLRAVLRILLFFCFTGLMIALTNGIFGWECWNSHKAANSLMGISGQAAASLMGIRPR